MTFSFTARPNTPLAAAIAIFFPSDPSDMSTTVCDSPTLMTSSLA